MVQNVQESKQNQKRILIIALIVTLLLVGIGITAFYYISISPRIEVYQALADAFGASSVQEDGDSAYELSFRDDFKIMLSFDEEWQNGRFLCEGKKKEGEGYRFEIGYNADNLWLSVPEVTESCYLISWKDDVVSQMKEAPICSFLGIDDDIMEKTGETLTSLRKYLLNEGKEKLESSSLNRFLGLDGLYADVLALYREVEFVKSGKETLNIEGTETLCHVYEMTIADDMMDLLLQSEGINEILRFLSDAVGDTSLTLWLNEDGELMKLSADSSFLYTPVWKTEDIGAEMLRTLELEAAPLHVELLWGQRRSDMEISVWLEAKNMSLELSLPGHIAEVQETGGWLFEAKNASFRAGAFQVSSECSVKGYKDFSYQAYEAESEIQLWEASRLRLLLEAVKWKGYLEEVLNGEDID